MKRHIVQFIALPVLILTLLLSGCSSNEETVATDDEDVSVSIFGIPNEDEFERVDGGIQYRGFDMPTNMHSRNQYSLPMIDSRASGIYNRRMETMVRIFW
jgi:hypothetical protein